MFDAVLVHGASTNQGVEVLAHIILVFALLHSVVIVEHALTESCAVLDGKAQTGVHRKLTAAVAIGVTPRRGTAATTARRSSSPCLPSRRRSRAKRQNRRANDDGAGRRQAIGVGKTSLRVTDIAVVQLVCVDGEPEIGCRRAGGLAPGASAWQGRTQKFLAVEKIEREIGFPARGASHAARACPASPWMCAGLHGVTPRCRSRQRWPASDSGSRSPC